MISRDSQYKYVLRDSIRLLVVDDDPVQREFAGVYLSTPDVDVVLAHSAGHAMEFLAGHKIDVVLTDCDMPEIDGVAFIRMLRAHSEHSELPVIMVTSFEDIETIDAAYEAGATAFTVKPVNWRLLSYQIDRAVRTARARKEAA